MKLSPWSSGLILLLLAGCAPRGEKPLIGDNVTFVDAGTTARRVNGDDAKGPAYFPPSFSTPSVPCDGPGKEVREPIVDDRIERGWYSGHLRAAEEPSLYLESQAPHAPGSATLRFTWLRSFHAPIIVRIETRGPDRQQLIAKQLSGAGGYAPGTINRRVDRPLTASEGRRLEELLVRTRLLALPPKVCDGGLDGAQWIIEAADRNGYHFVNRWTPREGAVREVGEYLLGLTGWNVAPIY